MEPLSASVERLIILRAYFLDTAVQTAQVDGIDTKRNIIASHVLDDSLSAEVGVEDLELVDEHLGTKSLLVGSQSDRGVVELV